jgi:hypothetical protein
MGKGTHHSDEGVNVGCWDCMDILVQRWFICVKRVPRMVHSGVRLYLRGDLADTVPVRIHAHTSSAIQFFNSYFRYIGTDAPG